MRLPLSEGEVKALPRSAAASVLVPVYSHVYFSAGDQSLNLTATVSIRNTDREASIIVNKATYFDSDGGIVRECLNQPIKLGPLATLELVVPEKDTAGGSGASMIVDWQASGIVPDPVIEAVFIGTGGTQGISFVSQGRVIAREVRNVPPGEEAIRPGEFSHFEP